MGSFRSIILCLLTTVSSILCGELADHFKKNPKDGGDHSMRNIDFVYIINLDQRPEKWELCQNQLNPYGVFPFRFSAVNGWEELSLETINDIGLKFSSEMEGKKLGTCYHLNDKFKMTHEYIKNEGQTYFAHCMSRGAIGIVMSHLSVLQDAYDSGYETIWVMEDDVEVLQDPRTISDLIDKLDKLVGKGNWDILFTDKDIRDVNAKRIPCIWTPWRPDYSPKQNPNNFLLDKKVGEDFRKIGARYGATSMIVRRSGMSKILQYFKAHQIFYPYDIDFAFPNDINLFTVLEDVVSNLPKSISDNGHPYYLLKGN